jgi:hypothetical protein
MAEMLAEMENDVKGLKTALIEGFYEMKKVLVKMEDKIEENPRKRRRTASENQVYQLRSNNINFSLGKPITNFVKKSISYSAASLWNSLPSLAKEQNSLSKFKSILDRS